MKMEEILLWLSPAKTWIKVNRDIEEDPDGQWHQCWLAWTMLEQTFNETVLGNPRLFTPTIEGLDLELLDAGSIQDRERPMELGMSSMQEDDRGTSGPEPGPDGAAPDVPGGVSSEVAVAGDGSGED